MVRVHVSLLASFLGGLDERAARRRTITDLNRALRNHIHMCRLNFGRGRAVPHGRKLFVHHSVNMRKPYKPKATWGDLLPIFVD